MEDKEMLKRELRKLIDIKKKYTAIKSQLNEISKEKNLLEKSVLKLTTELNLNDKTMMIDNNKIKIINTGTYQAISLKYLQESLTSYLGNEETGEELFNYLKDNREYKMNSEIKIIE
jgi:predicted nuclease with TOPRIM domain